MPAGDLQRLHLGGSSPAVESRIRTWDGEGYAGRLRARDPTLWADPGTPEITDRLGWLSLPDTMRAELAGLDEFAREVADEGFRHVVLLGMGGSSLGADVFRRTFGPAPGRPELIVLDSTHPDAVRAVAEDIDESATLFAVSSKSGTTIEPRSMLEFFWARAAAREGDPGRRFVAITDPGSPLGTLAAERGFRRVFEATPDVGGRYSALTAFGLVPAALLGVDLSRLLDGAAAMADDLGPALALGAALGELARAGRDKATYLVAPVFGGFGDWVEQLVAESTGKDGTGIVPVADEPLGPPEVYGDDRFFVAMGRHDEVAGLEEAGHPVARIRIDDPYDLGREMYRAEVAVAAAGSVLGIHPFDQPDVERAKQLARAAMEEGATDGGSIDQVAADDGAALRRAARDWLATAGTGDYLALQAYLPDEPATRAPLEEIRVALRDRTRLATTLGFGPRFLHSTGQLHKGGPNTGLFLQIVDRPGADLEVPGAGHGFGDLIAAQAAGDYRALREGDRRVLRIDLGTDRTAGLAALGAALAG